MFVDIYEIVSTSVLRNLSFDALKGMKVLPAVVESNDALNAFVWIDHAVGLTSGHAFGSGIYECFEFRFALDFGLPVSA